MDTPLAVVLAAGQGSRMKSDKPKVLCQVLGRPMIHFVLEALDQAGVDRHVVVVGYRAEDVRNELAGRENIEFALQSEQLGTGHAVKMCRAFLETHRGPVVVLAGDSPLVQASSIRELLDEFRRSGPACLLGTLETDDPTGLGRIVRGPDGEFLRIVEQKDASEQEKQIREVNLSVYVFDGQDLVSVLDEMSAENAQSEYYLTDCPELLRQAGRDVRALPVLKPCEAVSINTPEQLAEAERTMRSLGYDVEESR